MRFLVLILILAFYILNFTGCAPAPYVRPGITSAGMPGTYHKVERGQTLWRISKMYNADLEEIVSINHISDATNIEVGQLIFIPGRQKPQAQPVKYSLSDDFIWPLKGKVIATFGQIFNNMINKGINIQFYAGDVVAARSGKVVFFDDHFLGFGKTIIIDHGDGFSTVYAMNSQVFIKAGDYIEKRALIAKASTLHFEIRKGHIPQNPLFYLPR